MKARIGFNTVLLLLSGGATGLGCASSAEAEAERLCEAAWDAEVESLRSGLLLMRKLHSEMPTAGTGAALRCLRPLKEKMGRVRVLVTMDETGDPKTVEGCAWAAEAMEVFADLPHPPFRILWARRLMERCATAVGRAWTRAPDDPKIRAIHEKLKRHATQ